MSRFADLYGTFGVPALNDHHGETITRWPQGIEANAVSVTALVHFDDPQRDEDRGLHYSHTGTLDVAATQAVHVADQWVIGGKQYSTEVIGDPRHGRRQVKIKRLTSKRSTTAQQHIRGT